MTTLIKKISAKNIVGNIVSPAVGEEKELLVVIGFAKSSETKPTTYGDSTAFHGDFKAINAETGEEFRSGVCYLPDVAESLLANALDDATGAVEFGFHISVVGVKGRNPGEAGKYEYRVKPLMDTAENDPLQALEEKLKQKALAAPKDTLKVEEKKAAKK